MKMEVDFRMDLTETEADMLEKMVKIYYNIMQLHANDTTGMETKFYTEDKNEFFNLVEKLREVTGQELDY